MDRQLCADRRRELGRTVIARRVRVHQSAPADRNIDRAGEREHINDDDDRRVLTYGVQTLAAPVESVGVFGLTRRRK